ncbi:MAG: PD-(D/E)XK nuclease family protein [Treponema sp.]|nr:PD-(D/E)XK nuclease family protein [Treponema sp.]
MNHVEALLLENSGRLDALFVFPTETALSRWADRLLVARGGGTLAMEQFVAWDKFKQSYISSRRPGRKSAPAALRKIFASAVARKNAESCATGERPFFQALILPRWASGSDSFARWIAGILPGLALWHREAARLPISEIGSAEAARTAAEFSGEDADLFALALEYSSFLDENGLFEPAWESPPFKDPGKDCYIFFAEALSDFDEYKNLLEENPRVKIVGAVVPQKGTTAPQERNHEAFFYSNSRGEIAEAALYILALREKGVEWDSISVSLPEGQFYEPYLLREFENRNIPFAKLYGAPLASYPAGAFFADIANCASSDFSFASIAALLLNARLPWKQGAESEALSRFGLRNNCVSSWTEKTEDGERAKVNVWEDAFSRPLGGADPDMRKFFYDFKKMALNIRRAESFSEIRKSYFIFRERFFDMENCSEETNLVLARCISELMKLVTLENDFPSARAPDPCAFFVEHLRETTYHRQQPSSGVAILPYQAAAAAPFDCHIILGASQDSLQTVFAPLSFLSAVKRKKYNVKDNDASLDFIALHRFNSRLPAAFFCAEQTFSGYAIAHGALGANLKPAARKGGADNTFAADYFMEENRFLERARSLERERSVELGPLRALHPNQSRGFEAWSRRRALRPGSKAVFSREHPFALFARERFCKEDGAVRVSPSSLGPYFQCRHKWIFSRALRIEALEIDAALTADNMAGIAHHAVLNLFFYDLIAKGAPLPAPENNGSQEKPVAKLPAELRELLWQKIEMVFDNFPALPGGRMEMSMLAARLLRAQKKAFALRLERFLGVFLSFFAGFRAVESEARHSLDCPSAALDGTVDLVLQDARDDSQAFGSLAIVDFKTASAPELARHFKDSELSDFQIPAYLRLVETASGNEVSAATFFSVIDPKTRVWIGFLNNVFNGKRTPKKEDGSVDRAGEGFALMMTDFDEKAARFAREVSAGDFPAVPSYCEHCQKCEHQGICRSLYKVK